MKSTEAQDAHTRVNRLRGQAPTPEEKKDLPMNKFLWLASLLIFNPAIAEAEIVQAEQVSKGSPLVLNLGREIPIWQYEISPLGNSDQTAGEHYIFRSEDEVFFYFEPSSEETGALEVVLVGKREHRSPVEELRVLHLERIPLTGQKPRLLSLEAPLPSPEQYLDVLFTPTADSKGWVGTVVGLDLRIGAGQPGGIAERLKRPNIRELRIFGNQIVVTSPITLPGGSIFISARHLRFEGAGKLDITPTDRRPLTPEELNSRRGQTALKGEDAGKIWLNVETVQADDLTAPTPRERFVLNGGRGQDGGACVDGRPGADLPTDPRFLDWGHSVCKNREFKWTFIEQKYGSRAFRFGTDDRFPTHGFDALPGVTPGTGGNAGFLYAEASIVFPEKLITAVEGQPGNPVSGCKGGRAGTPQLSAWFLRERESGAFSMWSRPHFVEPVLKRQRDRGERAGVMVRPFCGSDGIVAVRTLPGNGTGPLAATPGAKGGRLSEALPNAAPPIVSEPLLRAVSRFTEDALLLEHYRTARDVAWFFLQAIESHGLGSEYPDLQARLLAVLGRTEAQRDYFGNPLGWVPSLSTLSYLASYEAVLENSLETIWMASWLENNWDSIRNKSAALDRLADNLEVEVAQAERELNSLAEKLALQQRTYSQALGELDVAFSLFRSQEDFVVAQALRNVRKKREGDATLRDLRTITDVFSVIPATAPYATAAKAILGPVSAAKAGASNEEIFRSASQAFSQISSISFSSGALEPQARRRQKPDPISDEIIEQLSSEAERVGGKLGLQDFGEDSERLQSIEAAVDSQVRAAISSNEEVGLLVDVISSLQTEQGRNSSPPSSGDVENEAARLRESGEYREVASRVALAEKNVASVRKELENLKDQASTYAARLAEARKDTNRIRTQQSDLASTRAWVLKDTVARIRRRAEDRLLLFKYWILKSFQFDFLRTPPGFDMRLTRMINELSEEVESMADVSEMSSMDHRRLTERGRVLFRNEINAVATAFMSDLTDEPPRRTRQRFLALSTQQIRALNDEGEVTLHVEDLASVFRPGEYDERIIEIAIESFKIDAYSRQDFIDLKIDFDEQITVLGSDNELYYFTYGGAANGYDFSWYGFRPEQFKSSGDDEGLQALFEQFFGPDAQLTYQSRSARSPITIRKASGPQLLELVFRVKISSRAKLR